MGIKLFLYSCFISFLFTSCKTGPSLFGKKNLHDQYAKKLESSGLLKSEMGKNWLTSANKALNQPYKIALPYSIVGYFPAEQPTALGVQFDSKHGEKLLFNLKRNPIQSFPIYIDLWKQNPGNDPSLFLSVDTSTSSFEYEIDESGTYILRIQPELLVSGDYTLTISVGPSLEFPVSQGRIGSFWGADRDAGRRSHEGIDIFAPRGTPVLAAADGIVSKVGLNNLGGKVIFIRPEGKNISLYYAHLDSQLVKAGKHVQVGDTIGLVGNTGNARTTSPHLHLGIYALGGAIDPLPFIDPQVKRPRSNNFNYSDLRLNYRLVSNQRIGDSTFRRNQLIKVIAAGSDKLLASSPGGIQFSLGRNKAEPVDDQLVTTQVNDTAFVLEQPSLVAPKKLQLAKAASVSVLGYNNEFAFIRYRNITGWIPVDQLN